MQVSIQAEIKIKPLALESIPIPGSEPRIRWRVYWLDGTHYKWRPDSVTNNISKPMLIFWRLPGYKRPELWLTKIGGAKPAHTTAAIVRTIATVFPDFD